MSRYVLFLCYFRPSQSKNEILLSDTDFKNIIAMGNKISKKLNLKRKDVGRVIGRAIKETRNK
ncbi:MAG: hypothetical protein ACYCUW_01350 [bacterium]